MAGASQIRVLLVAMATICLASGMWAQTSKPTIRHHRIAEPGEAPELTAAETALEKRDYAAALKLLEPLAQGDEKDHRVWFDLGFVYNALGRADDSISAYRKAVAAKPDVFESNLNLGLMLARGNHPDAAAFLRAATQLKPASQAGASTSSDKSNEGHARAWLSLGHVVEATKPEEAAAAYREAARLQPKDPEPQLSLGALLDKQKDPAGAEAAYKEALVLDPHSDALAALANLYMRGKRFTEAETMLRKIATERPNDAVIHLQLGRVLAAEQKNDEAADELQATLKISPSDQDAAHDLADIYVAVRKFAQAEPLYRQLLTSNPNDADLHQSLGHVLLEQRKYPEAQAEFLAAIKLKPDLPAAYGELAAAASENKDFVLTIRALDARARLIPETPVTYFLRATAFDHLRDYKKAAEQYHKFLDVAQGKFPDQEWQARHRLVAIEPKK